MCAALSIVTDNYHQHYYLEDSESAVLWLGRSASATDQGIPVDEEYGYDYMHPTSRDSMSTHTWSLSTVSVEEASTSF